MHLCPGDAFIALSQGHNSKTPVPAAVFSYLQTRPQVGDVKDRTMRGELVSIPMGQIRTAGAIVLAPLLPQGIAITLPTKGTVS